MVTLLVESNGHKDKMLSIEKHLEKTEPYLNNLIDNHKYQCEWNIQFTVAIKFISSKNSDETHTTHTKSDNIEIMIVIETDEIIEELLNSLLQRYQKILKNQWKEFILFLIALICCIRNFLK